MDVRETIEIGVPRRWILSFQRTSSLAWANWIPGRFKHVCAFAAVPETDWWLFYDVRMNQTILGIARGNKARAAMLAWTENAEMVGYDINPDNFGSLFRFGFFCVPAIKHLLGIRCVAILPDRLHSWLLRNGGTLIGEPAQDPDRSAAHPVAAAGQG